jgi:HlyD family secretion protein
MKTKKLSLVLCIAVLLASCSSNKEKILEGKVKRETISLAPKLAGRIIKIYVKESDFVHKGDTLAILDMPEVEAKMQQAEGAFFAASSQYEMAVHGATKDQKQQVIAMYNSALEQFQLAEKSLTRIRNMYNDSLVSPQAYDEALTKYNMAKAQLDAASAKKQEVIGGIRDEQVRMALGQKRQAEGTVKETHVAANERYILAPKDMTIETIALHEGELALPGYNLFIGYDPATTWFRFTVEESLINTFKKDSVYTVELPFDNHKTLTTKLVSVNELAKYGNKSSSYPNYQLGEAVYELKLIPDDKAFAGELFNNYSVLLKITIKK